MSGPSNETYRMRGAGDGVKTHHHPHQSSHKAAGEKQRVPVPSSRKFTPTVTPSKLDPTMQLKLKRAIEELESKPLAIAVMKKAKSVAEITPTKSKPSQRLSRGNVAMSTETTLHATPRPMDSTTPPSRRAHRQLQASQMVFRRWLLYAWRQRKTRLSDLGDSLRRHADRVTKLDRQIVVLNDLRKSECNKREEALASCQKMKIELDCSLKEIEAVLKQKSSLENELNDAKSSLKVANDDLLNAKNDLCTRNVRLEELEDEINQMREQLMAVVEERASLSNKVRTHETDGKSLKEKLSAVGNQLRHEQFEKEVLEEKLSQFCKDLAYYVAENENLKLKIVVMEKRNVAKEFAASSWCIVQKVLYIMLPAYNPYTLK